MITPLIYHKQMGELLCKIPRQNLSHHTIPLNAFSLKNSKNQLSFCSKQVAKNFLLHVQIFLTMSLSMFLHYEKQSAYLKQLQLCARSSQRRSSNHDCFVHTQLHTRLTEFLMTLVCLVLLFFNPPQSV